MNKIIYLIILIGAGILLSPHTIFAVSPTDEKNRVDVAAFNTVYKFSLNLPSEWKAVSVPKIAAIALYDPSAQGDGPLEKSQVFIRHFSAEKFLTLSTVTIHSKKILSLQGHDAVLYDIEKKKNIPSFPYQPSWRNARHTVLDIRYAPTKQSSFFVFAKNPSLDEQTFQNIIQSLTFYNDSKSFYQPLSEAKKRITKKPFGILIDSKTSPVQPERFAGFHTGTDYEIFDSEKNKPIAVRAICGGIVVEKKETQGYGGILIQECQQGKQVIRVLYGHLDIKNVPYKKGTYLSPGSRLGVLATADTAASGFERTHLHLGVLKDRSRDIRGYVSKEKELTRWINAENFLAEANE